MIVGNGSEAIEEKEVENDESKEVENDENNDKPNLQDKMIPNPQVGVPYYLAFVKFNQEVEERKMSTTTPSSKDVWSVTNVCPNKQDWKWISVLTASILGLAALEVDKLFATQSDKFLKIVKHFRKV